MSHDFAPLLADKRVANATTGLALAREIAGDESLTKSDKARDVYQLFRHKTLSFAVA